MAEDAVFIGATVVAAEDSAEFFSTVKIPGNMTVEKTKANHVAKVSEERAAHTAFPPLGFAGSIVSNNDKYENHVHRPLVGCLASVTVLSRDGAVLFTAEDSVPYTRGKVAVPFVNYLVSAFPGWFRCTLYSREPCTKQPVFFGFNLKQVLRIAAFDVLRFNLENKINVVVPVQLWHNPPNVYDVCDVMLSQGDQRDLDLYSLLCFFNITATPAALASSSQQQAEVVRLLVERGQLAPTLA